MTVFEKINAGVYEPKKEYPNYSLRKTDLELYKQLAKEYNIEHGLLQEQFRLDAIEEVGLKGHPKADKAYSYAWQQGHHAGYSEVLSHLQDIAEVVL